MNYTKSIFKIWFHLFDLRALFAFHLFVRMGWLVWLLVPYTYSRILITFGECKKGYSNQPTIATAAISIVGTGLDCEMSIFRTNVALVSRVCTKFRTSLTSNGNFCWRKERKKKQEWVWECVCVCVERSLFDGLVFSIFKCVSSIFLVIHTGNLEMREMNKGDREC